ncbi:MAG: hypothetical protein Q9202_004120 [Teloschistes flavicans]
MLYLVGLGLADETDITVKGLNVVKAAERVYLEAYTSILMVQKDKLEVYYGRPIILADREMVESSSDEILAGADKVDVAFLVVGDPFGATTHTDLVLRARELKIPTQTIHNASIMSAIGATGLQLYNFGQTVSMVFFTESWRPSSFYDRVQENRRIGLHTLMLLDIKVKEQSLENLARGRRIFEPPRFMTASQCAAQMLEIEQSRSEGAYGPDVVAVGIARLGAIDQRMAAGTLKQISEFDMGAPLHSLVLLGKRVHDLERDYLREYAIDRDRFDQAWQEQYKCFKWARNEIRVHVVLQEVDDAAPNNLMSGESEEAMNENFCELYPGPMAKLPPLRFIEPLNANNEKFNYPSEPFAFVADAVVQSEDWIDVTHAMNKAHIPAAQWDAMADLRDLIAKGEKIGWFVVHNGDRELAKQERLRKELNGFASSMDETEAQAEAIESKYSKELSEQVANLQLPSNSNGKEVKDAPHERFPWPMTD